ncbi:MAG: hypothetical protein ABWY16_21420 [Pedobacter sp.]
MGKQESAEEFFLERNVEPGIMGQFNVFEMEKFCERPMQYSRRDF